jgi:hypothetical protein
LIKISRKDKPGNPTAMKLIVNFISLLQGQNFTVLSKLGIRYMLSKSKLLSILISIFTVHWKLLSGNLSSKMPT